MSLSHRLEIKDLSKLMTQYGEFQKCGLFNVNMKAQRVPDHVVVFFMCWPQERGCQICHKLRVRMKVLTPGGKVIARKKADKPGFGIDCRVVQAVFQEEELSAACVNDAVIIEAHFRLSVIEPAFGDPSSPVTGPEMMYRLAADFLRDDAADVTFLVSAEGKEFRASKRLLAAQSPVFKVMFYGSMIPKDAVRVPDIPVQAFTTLLRYVYCEEIVVDKAYIAETAEVAEKYDIPDLSYGIGHLVDVETFAIVANKITPTTSYDHMKVQLADFLEKQAPSFYASDHFMILNPDAMKLVVETSSNSHRMIAITQARLWSHIEKWAGVYCRLFKGIADPKPLDKRAAMISFLDLFQFDQMTLREFMEGPKASGILTDRLIVRFMNKFCNCNQSGTNGEPFQGHQSVISLSK